MSSNGREGDLSRASELGKLSLILVQLLAIGWLIPRLDLEPYAFARELWWAMIAAQVVHHFLPRSQQPTFFLGFSVFAIGFVFGFPDSAWILGVAMAFFAVCHLPIRVGLRAALLALATIVLAAMRVGIAAPPWSPAVWPILASMLMFRTIVYLRDVVDGKVAAGDAGALAYFFLFPNVAFPLFPIVDYATFRRRFYDREAFAIYQRGVETILRGFVHLLVYRFVTHYVATAAEDVVDPSSLVKHLVGNFALVLRVSGQFHLVVGILHLFGFRLPRIMNLFFLATSFTDFWRRVNVYWKDFIQKMIFYPVFLRIRSLSERSRLIVAMGAAFTLTWFLHAYQWFWIQGRFLVSTMDVAFWTILGLAMIANAVIDARPASRKALAVDRKGPIRSWVSRALRAMATFAAITVLWSLWVSESPTDWFSLWGAAHLDGWAIGAILLGTLVLFLAATAVFTSTVITNDEVEAKTTVPLRLALRSLTPALALFVIALAPIRDGSGAAADVLMSLRSSTIAARDEDLLTRGYYEDLTDVARFSPELWNLYLKRRPDWFALETMVRGDGLLEFEMAASQLATAKGAPLRTNRWGMRDRDYGKRKPAGSYRIALLGGSATLGKGVRDEETYENLAENRLNANAATRRVEILNFSVAGYSVLQQLALVDRRVFDFEPDVVAYAGHYADRDRLVTHLADLIQRDRDLEFPFLRQLALEAGISKEMGRAQRSRALKAHVRELLSWVYGEIVARCRSRGVEPVYAYVPLPWELNLPPRRQKKLVDRTIELAREAGFSVIDLSDAYRGQKSHSIRIADWDDHPNKKGHRLLGERLAGELARPGGLLDTASDGLQRVLAAGEQAPGER